MLPIPAPDPATPAALAPAPMYLAAESMSRLTAVVCNCCWGCTVTAADTARAPDVWLMRVTRGVNLAALARADIVEI